MRESSVRCVGCSHPHLDAVRGRYSHASWVSHLASRQPQSTSPSSMPRSAHRSRVLLLAAQHVTSALQALGFVCAICGPVAVHALHVSPPKAPVGSSGASTYRMLMCPNSLGGPSWSSYTLAKPTRRYAEPSHGTTPPTSHRAVDA